MQILKRLGFAPLEAGTVREAVGYLTAPPQWILLDLMLPDGSGVDVLRKVRAERLPSRVCVISGCDPSVLQTARAAGADHVLTKPLDVSRLIDVLAPVEATATRN